MEVISIHKMCLLIKSNFDVLNSFQSKIFSTFNDFIPVRKMDGLRALDLLQLLQERFVILTGGRDRRGGPILSFPSTPRRERIKPEDIRRLLTYLFGIPK